MTPPTVPMSPRARGPGITARAGLAVARALVGGRFTRGFANLSASLTRSADELLERQAVQIRGIVRHAITKVPFWRDAARGLGMEPGDVCGLGDLQRLPIVDKQVFRSRPLQDFLAEGLPGHRRIPYTTSGSTGDPFAFVLDRDSMPIVFASHLFFDSWYGLDPFDTSVRILGRPAPEPALPADTPLRARLGALVTRRVQRSYERLTQRRLVTLDVTPSSIRATLESFRPVYLLGYTSTLAVLAEEFLRIGYRPSRPLRAVITIAETLTPERRRLIEECFGAPIANRYGQREFKFWCAQSPASDPTRFLVHPELVVFETIRPDGGPAAEDETGRVVLTNLHNQVMPFLRYDTGDIATRRRPDAGSPLPVMGRLDGRTQEVLSLPSGRKLDASTVGHMLFVVGPFTERIRLYQVIQERPDRLRLRLVARGSADETLAAELRAALLEIAGPGVEIVSEFVDDIPLESSGKRPVLMAHRTAAEAHVR